MFLFFVVEKTGERGREGKGEYGEKRLIKIAICSMIVKIYENSCIKKKPVLSKNNIHNIIRSNLVFSISFSSLNSHNFRLLKLKSQIINPITWKQ